MNFEAEKLQQQINKGVSDFFITLKMTCYPLDLRMQKIEQRYKQWLINIETTSQREKIENFIKNTIEVSLEKNKKHLKELIERPHSLENANKIRHLEWVIKISQESINYFKIMSYNEPKRIENNRKMKIKQELEQIL